MASLPAQFFSTALPNSHPLNKHTTPLAVWNSDHLLKSYLAGCDEPPSNVDVELLKGRALMFRYRMFELDAQRIRIAAEGRISMEVDRELASILYKRKLLLWMTFPILELPSEILTIIFRYVVWSSLGADQANLHRLRLSWVCRRFRQIALGDQTLWNSIWFRDSFPWERSFTFIERSGTSYLDLRINEKERRPGEQANPTHPAITVPQIDLILDVILPKISQIRILVVIVEREDVAERFVSRFSTAGYPALLERYEVHRSGKPYLWPHEKATGFGGQYPLSVFPTPKLRWLSLNGIPLDWTKFNPANLRTIDLRRMPLQACPTSTRWTEMLEASPWLYKLSLDAAGPQWSPTRLQAARRINLPNLRDLLIGDVSCLFGMYMLAHINAPDVMSLSLMHLTGQDYTQLIQLLTGMFPKLRLLAMWTVETPTEEDNLRVVVRWLESMPRLKMLKIAEMKRFILDAFYVDPTRFWSNEQTELYAEKWKEQHGDIDIVPPVLLPELQYLYFQAQKDDDVSSLIKGRKRIGKPFTRAFMPDVNSRWVEQIGLQAEIAEIEKEVDLSVVFHQVVSPIEEEIQEEMAATQVPGHSHPYRPYAAR